MKNCPVCQKVLTDQAKFCYFCGASLLEPTPADPEAMPEETVNPPAAEPLESVVPAPEAEPVAEAVEPSVPEIADVPSEPAEPTVAEEADAVEAPVEPDPVAVPVEAPVSEPPKAEPKPEPTIVATDSRSLMTTAGYIFTTILFHIPIIGLIFMIVWGCGKTKNISRKRFSLACLIMRLIGYIVVLSAAVFLLICFSGKFPALWAAVQPILFP